VPQSLEAVYLRVMAEAAEEEDAEG